MNNAGGAPSPMGTVGEGFWIALGTMRANKVRTGLTVLGVAIGVSVVVTMAALVTGIRSSLTEAFEASGPQNFVVTRFDMSEVREMFGGSGRLPWWNKPKITPLEVQRIAELPGVEEAIIDFDMTITISAQGRRVADVQGSANTAGWPGYTIGDFVAGRNFIPSEVEHSRPVIVISQGLARELFGQIDPIGKSLRVSEGGRSPERFSVVGVYEIGENIFSEAAQYFAILPYTAVLKELKASDEMLAVLVVPEERILPAEVQDQVIGLLRTMRGLGPREENNFAIIRSSEMLDSLNQLTGVFFVVMVALSSVGLMVGGVGVIGIMLISVTERTREIGVRKAVGATRREILWQFLVEAGVLTLTGAVAGLILGGGMAYLAEAATPIPAAIPFWSVAAGLAMALLTGMLFGLLPAIRASRLEPVDALRYE